MPTIGTSTGIASVDIVDSSVTGTDVLDLTLTTADIAASSRLDLRGVYNVKDAAYGAVGDGSTDDRPAINSALTAAASGGVVYIPAGTYLLNTTGPLSLPQLSATQSLKIVGAGANATTIKLSTTCKRAFDLRRVADYNTFRNIEISDLTVDANSVASTSGQHILLGNLVDGAWDKRLNFDGITVRRCRGVNAPAADTDTASTGTTGSRQWISIVSRHATSGTSTGDTTNASASIANATDTWRVGATISGTNIPAGTYVIAVSGTTLTLSENATATASGVTLTGSYKESTQTSVKNVLVEDCDFSGGACGVVVMGGADSGGSAANVYCDRIYVNRVRWDRGSTASATSVSAGVQIGGTGYGGRCVIRDSYLINAGDVGIEIDGMTYSLVDNTTCRDAYNANHFVRNFAGPEYPNEQIAIFSRCQAEVVNINPTIAGGQSLGYYLSSTSAPNPPIANAVLSDCSFLSKAANMAVAGQAVNVPSGATLKKLIIRGLNIDHSTISYTPGTGSDTPSYVRLTPSSDWTLFSRDVTIKVAGTVDTHVAPLYYRVGAGGSLSVKFYIDGLAVDSNVVGVTNGNTYHLHIGASITCTGSGQIKGYKAVRLGGDTLPKRIGIDGSGTLTIDKKITISDCDFGSGTGGFEVRYDGTSNAASVFYGDGIIWGTNTGNPPSLAAGGTLTIPDAPFVIVTGNTNITALAPNRIGRVVTLKFSGTPTFTAGATLKLAGAANFVATADDTLTLGCDGTNWYEITRSANA